MSNTYQWAAPDGSIIEAEYNESVDRLSHDAVRTELIDALQQFGHVVQCDPVSDNPKEEVYKVSVRSADSADDASCYVCIKEMTPGGRLALKDEQRIQQQSRFLNFAYSQAQAGDKAVLLGVYRRGGDTIFCAWKLKESTTERGTTISKQIKITTIASAMKEGFVQQEKGHGEFACAFRREFIFFYIRNSDWLHGETVTALTEHDASVASDAEHDGASEDGGESTPLRILDESTRVSDGANYLLYGVPGSGKSYTVKTEYCDDEERMERVVFHPDYTYSDFVGQIAPMFDRERRVYYDFLPGPFTRMLKKAYINPGEEFFLVIEELNRGNAPAIFGEAFQLLDRKEEAEEGAIGESSYGITNANVAEIVYGDAEHQVRIPSNLNVVATMNTSDQNVFTMDTAFQRRWHMRMIENNVGATVHAGKTILDTTVTWEQFNKAINMLILKTNAQISSSEDKRLGAYFVTPRDVEFSSSSDVREADKQNRRFPEKVLKYLWDDAFKFSRDVIFDTDKYPCLEDVIRTFKTSSGNARFNKIFQEGVLGDIGD
jgi:hypothetical protein